MGDKTPTKGDKFTRWTINSNTSHVRGKHRFIECLCTCGSVKDVRVDGLITGRSKSCGCLKNELTRSRNKIREYHTQTNPKYKQQTYHVWQAAFQRSMNPNNKYYKGYGARGIVMCKEWCDSYEQFMVDMGQRPLNTTLERIDNDKGYNPDNCKWATRAEQAQNRRVCVFNVDSVKEVRYLHKYENYTFNRLAKKYGCDEKTVRSIINFESWKNV